MEANAQDQTVPQDSQGGIAGATERHDRDGFEGQFQVVEGAQLRCLSCDRSFAVAEVSQFDETRVEGASDPADLGIVIALECPRCSTKGTLVARYGPEASADEADVLQALARDRQ